MINSNPDLEELNILLKDVRNLKSLPSYEQRFVLSRVSELILLHKNVLGTILTERALFATLVLWNSSEASRIPVPLQLGRQRPR